MADNPSDTTAHHPAILTELELRTWLRSIGLKGIRLPRDLDRVLYVDQPGGGLWRIRPLITGAFAVSPFQALVTEQR